VLLYFYILEIRASKLRFLFAASGIHGSKAGHSSGSDVNLMFFHFTFVKGQKNEEAGNLRCLSFQTNINHKTYAAENRLIETQKHCN
jgi:hypothetical protein